jgi:cyanophycinase
VSGLLALVGGGEFTDACAEVDRRLVEASGGAPVLVVPTAAAFEHPERAVATAVAWFESLGVEAIELPVLGRTDALSTANVEAARQSRFTYLAGGSPMHLRSVLKATPLWLALGEAWRTGGVLAGSSAGAMVLTDPMVDPRGGAFTVGLGLVPALAVVPHAETWHAERMRRTLDLADRFPLVTLATGAAVMRDGDGAWTSHGSVGVYVGGHLGELSALP